MDVSVALCTYNGMPYLPEQMESILNQSRKPDQIVVSDDGSSDGTLDYLSEIAAEHPDLIELHHNDHTRGIAKNFEAAIRRCTGDVIALSDQDDWWDQRKLRKQLDVYENEGADFIFHNSAIASTDLELEGDTLWSRLNPEFDPDANTGKSLLNELVFRNVVQGATILFSSELREYLLPIPEVWQYDHYLALVGDLVATTAAIDDTLLQYRQHEEQDRGVQRTEGTDRILNRLGFDYQYYRTRAHRWKLLKKRVAEIPDSDLRIDREQGLSLIGSRTRYFTRRAMTQDPTQSVHKRLTAVGENIIQDYYSPYANRWVSGAKDCLLALVAGRSRGTDSTETKST